MSNTLALPGTALDIAVSAADQNLIDRAYRLIFDRAGILVPEHKGQATLRALQSMSEQHQLQGVEALLSALQTQAKHDAWPAFIAGFTINHTAFFRESHHFTHMGNEVKSRGALSVWSAACSTGEEPYSVAMTINEVLGEQAAVPKIWATDIDEKAIAHASSGVYAQGTAEKIESTRLKRHFMRGVDDRAGKIKIKPAVRARVNFDFFNLNSKSWPSVGPFDVVFCRNTMIYFDRPTQTRLMHRFADVMRKDALLYVGHSENIANLTDRFKLLGQTIYQKI